MKNPIALALIGMALVNACVSNTLVAASFPDASALPSHPGLPDPLKMFDGRPITSETMWRGSRVPELKAMFQHYMYGDLPPKPGKVKKEKLGEFEDLFGGKATLKLTRLQLGNENDPALDVMLVVPTEGRGPFPVFVGMNFCGNHALLPDPRIPLARGWVYSNCKDCPNNKATDASRGSQAQDWAIEQTIQRGYAFAAFCSSDVDSDRADVSDGIKASLAKKRNEPVPTKDRGSIACWAWGFHRVVDYLIGEPGIDSKRIAVVGHSRNGKTALLAAAMDERIALAIPHQAGCGGTAPSRGTVGESVKQINDRFPHWFNGKFKDFNTQTDRLPFDQHTLVAMMAPRPVLLSNAVEDQWANPSGQFEMLKAAEPVYRLLGAGSLESAEMPPLEKLVSSPLGYYIRPGKHSMNRGDWAVFLDFADRHFKTKKP